MCLFHPTSEFYIQLHQYALFYPIILSALRRTLGPEQLHVVSPSSELSWHLLCTPSVTLTTLSLHTLHCSHLRMCVPPRPTSQLKCKFCGRRSMS